MSEHPRRSGDEGQGSAHGGETVERRLEAWGSEDRLVVDGAFANRLEARLRELAAEQHASRPVRPLWQPLALAAVSLLVVVVGVFALTGSSGDDDLLVMGVASDTQVVLPGGDVVVAREGLALSDGTRISVGPDGSAVVGDVVLGADTEAVIADGTVEILVDERSTTSAPPTTAARPATTRLPDDATSSPSRDGDGTTTQPTTSTTTSRSSTTDGRETTTTSRTATTSTTSERSTTTAARPIVELTWTESNGQVQLSWTYAGPDTFAGWEVVVTSGDRGRTLALLRDPAARSLTVASLDAVVSYRVVALAGDGVTIVESNSVEVP